MAEVKINQLPTMASSEFTDNDYFLVVDDGSARLLSRPTFQAWMRENVKGEKGEQGVAGKDGKDGVNGTNGKDGKDGRSVVSVYCSEGRLVVKYSDGVASTISGSVACESVKPSPVVTVSSRK